MVDFTEHTVDSFGQGWCRLKITASPCCDCLAHTDRYPGRTDISLLSSLASSQVTTRWFDACGSGSHAWAHYSFSFSSKASEKSILVASRHSFVVLHTGRSHSIPFVSLPAGPRFVLLSFFVHFRVSCISIRSLSNRSLLLEAGPHYPSTRSKCHRGLVPFPDLLVGGVPLQPHLVVASALEDARSLVSHNRAIFMPPSM